MLQYKHITGMTNTKKRDRVNGTARKSFIHPVRTTVYELTIYRITVVVNLNDN